MSPHNSGDPMKPRDRVLRAFRRQYGLSDRVPVQFDLCRQLLEHFSQKLNIPIRYTHNLWEDVTCRISGNEIRTAMGCDVVVTGAGLPAGYEIRKDARGCWRNEYGMIMKQGTIYVEPISNPLAHVASASDLNDYQFPNPNAPGRFNDARQLVRRFHDDYVVIGDIELTVFALARTLVGMEKLLMDMAAGAEYIDPLFRRCVDFQIEIGRGLVQAGVDAIWVGDDFGSQSSLLFSPGLFRTQVKDHYARLIQSLKQANPQVIPIIHSDGAVGPLLDDLHEVGFEVFNPVQPGVPGHAPKELKDRFGDKFAFWGAIDQQQLLPRGTDEELETDIQQKLNILGKNGGYMIAPAHILQVDVSPQRVETFIRLCMKYGRYS
ncbi:MAG: uroporphyrinogen decarboxylase family protein [Phycisphaerales bacterium]